MAKKSGKFGISLDDFDVRNIPGVTAERIEEANEKGLTEDSMDPALREKLIYLTDEQLEDDPYNQKYYRPKPNELEYLARSMREYGFRGVILAYPIGGGKYRIESGHRRRAAARMAGIEKYVVFVTAPPKTDWERRMNLFIANLNDRKDSATPIDKALAAQGLYEAFRDKRDYMKDQGTLEDGAETRLNYLVASEMHEDHSTVERLRALLNLIPQLQELVDAGKYSWVAISGASVLSKENQLLFLRLINEKAEKDGEDAVTRLWLQSTVKSIRDGEYEREEDKSLVVHRMPKRRYSAKSYVKVTSNVISMLEGDDSFRKEEIPDVIGQLRKLQESLDAKIRMLEIRAEN